MKFKSILLGASLFISVSSTFAGPLLQPTFSLGCGVGKNFMKHSVKVTHAFGGAGQFYQNTGVKLRELNGSNVYVGTPLVATINTNGNWTGIVNGIVAGKHYFAEFHAPTGTALTDMTSHTSLKVLAPTCGMVKQLDIKADIKVPK